MCRATTDTPPGMGLALVAVMRGWRPSTPCPECFTAPPSLQIAGYPGRWGVAAYLEAGKVKVSCWQAQLHTRQAQRRQCTRQLCRAGQHTCWCVLHQPPCGCVRLPPVGLAPDKPRPAPAVLPSSSCLQNSNILQYMSFVNGSLVVEVGVYTSVGALAREAGLLPCGLCCGPNNNSCTCAPCPACWRAGRCATRTADVQGKTQRGWTLLE